MTASETGPPVVPLPAPLGRRMRLGPFPSARDALKFLTVAAVGALVAGWVSPWLWLPFLGGGFVLSTQRADGRGWDDRIAGYVRYRVRRGSGIERSAPVGPSEGVGRRPSNGLVAVLVTGGLPIAFLPPSEARGLYERYLELLRGLEGRLFLYGTTAPLNARPFRPSPPPSEGEEERAAREGYREMVELICRRRRRREVAAVLATDADGPGDRKALERRLARLREGLERLGLTPMRPRGAALDRWLRRLGEPEVPG